MRTQKQIQEWLMTVSDDMLKRILTLVYNEGRRRGWSEFWTI